MSDCSLSSRDFNAFSEVLQGKRRDCHKPTTPNFHSSLNQKKNRVSYIWVTRPKTAANLVPGLACLDNVWTGGNRTILWHLATQKEANKAAVITGVIRKWMGERGQTGTTVMGKWQRESDEWREELAEMKIQCNYFQKPFQPEIVLVARPNGLDLSSYEKHWF